MWGWLTTWELSPSSIRPAHALSFTQRKIRRAFNYFYFFTLWKLRKPEWPLLKLCKSGSVCIGHEIYDSFSFTVWIWKMLKHCSSYSCKLFASNYKCANRCYATLEAHSYIKYVQHFSLFLPAQIHMVRTTGIFFYHFSLQTRQKKVRERWSSSVSKVTFVAATWTIYFI